MLAAQLLERPVRIDVRVFAQHSAQRLRHLPVVLQPRRDRGLRRRAARRRERVEPLRLRAPGQLQVQDQVALRLQHRRDLARQIQDDRAAQAGVREDEVAADLDPRFAAAPQAEHGARDRVGGAARGPVLLRDQRHHARMRRDEAVAATRGQPTAAVAAAERRVAAAATRQDDRPCGQRGVQGADADHAVAVELETGHRASGSQFDLEAADLRGQRVQDGARAVVGGEDVEAVGRVGGGAEVEEKGAQAVAAQAVERGLHEAAEAAEAVDVIRDGQRVGDVAATAARGEQLAAASGATLEQEDGRARAGGGDGGGEAGGAGACDDDVVHGRNLARRAVAEHPEF